MNIIDIIDQLDWRQIQHDIITTTADKVIQALSHQSPGLEQLKALLSPAADPFLEQMAIRSCMLTKQRFGKTIQLYIPLYLSNLCTNSCRYCGFSIENRIKRIILDENAIYQEISAIKAMGFDHVLLVTGEAENKVGIDYFRKILPIIKSEVSHITMEVQPLRQKEYIELIDLGLDAVLVYQETYNRNTYKYHHLRGQKTNFNYRLQTPDRLGHAAINKIGLGILLGLDDWRTESFYLAVHLAYLEQRFWQSRYSISFPRLRPCAGMTHPKNIMTDRQLAQLITAFRIINQTVELTLSTRESVDFRNNIIPLGITSISAGSSTQPGGYSKQNSKQLSQFEINDDRSPNEVAKMIKQLNYQPIWKDWDKNMNIVK